MRVISKHDQQELLNMREVISETGKALQAYSEGKTETPLRYSLPYNKDNRYLVMPALSEELGIVGIKTVSYAPRNPQKGKQTIEGSVLLTDYDTGETLAVLDGAYLTKIRTGAISGVATQYLARQNAETLSVIGTGEQAEGLIEAVLAVRAIKRIQFFNRTYDKAVHFAKQINEKYSDIETEVYKDVATAMDNSDIVITATNSSQPVFKGQLAPGTHLNAVGSFKPDMQELPSESVVNADKVVVEATEAALEETGDFFKPIEEGKWSAKDLHGELGRIVSGELAGRESPEEVTLFKSVGLAIVDIVVANYFYNKVVEQDRG
ncbi:ornithine cyclodeaminase family protein [Staphylococcus sp. SQ8-PEA]|uniref:Ornithine cyclodeaminase family protein n=1 Tax=Staphylococcus marylandisciuri TaxID=2981529 RepID=A0ABT2QRV4_9STAP|nr:ornithine cyclodeaminase family protein [Staphylococcus marylandisciuri]MCU5746667.1 ornithine cyclodeaminase family protein [Staphylococcus marylandisciuri]